MLEYSDNSIESPNYVSVIRDLTQQRILHEKLRESEERCRAVTEECEAMIQRKDKFFAMVIHELRNRLAPLLNTVQILSLEQADNPSTSTLLSVMEGHVQQLDVLVNDLLETARLNASKLQLHRNIVDARIAIEGAVEASRPLVTEGGHELVLSMPDEPVWIYADPVRLEQIFINVLNNAAKYTKEPGKISVNVTRQDGNATVAVTDTGVGIAADMLDRIFELFAQCDSSLDLAHDGLGIGLTLVKILVEMHGGTISAHSDGPNQGSTFVIRLPISTRPQKNVVNVRETQSHHNQHFGNLNH
jgi:signal transduction histidine kinase